MKAGRNDPCPCGSGKKYKKCCLSRDQEAVAKEVAAREAAAREAATKPPPSSLIVPARPVASPMPHQAEPAWPTVPAGAEQAPAPAPPPDPITQKQNALWDEFKSKLGEDRVAMFLEALNDPEVMSDDLAFEMLQLLRPEAVASDRRARFAECVAALRERLPEVFEKSGAYYLSLCLLDALAEGRQEVVPSLARDLAARAGRDIDIFNRSAETLAYHGQLDVLLDALRIGWPLVKSSSDVVPWGISEFAERGVIHEIYHYLEHTDSPDPADPALLDRVRFFIDEPNEDHLRELIGDLTANSGREWQAADFALRPPRKRSRGGWDDDTAERQERDPGATNLNRLINSFVGYLRREEGVPFPRGELVRHEIYSYFLKRHEGKLNPRLSMLEEMQNPRAKPPKPPRPIHPLGPEPVTLEAHLAGMMGFMNARYYPAAALFQAMPAWLRFLESRRLIDADISRKCAGELLPLHNSMLELWKTHTEDLSLYQQELAWQASREGA
ncbi:MAG: YecA family protein [Isosphaeraceae bacterium]